MAREIKNKSINYNKFSKKVNDSKKTSFKGYWTKLHGKYSNIHRRNTVIYPKLKNVMVRMNTKGYSRFSRTTDNRGRTHASQDSIGNYEFRDIQGLSLSSPYKFINTMTNSTMKFGEVMYNKVMMALGLPKTFYRSDDNNFTPIEKQKIRFNDPSDKENIKIHRTPHGNKIYKKK